MTDSTDIFIGTGRPLRPAGSITEQGVLIVSKTTFRTRCVVLALLAATAGAACAEEHVVSQKNKSFSTKKLKVKVGDSIKFVNEDSFAHNVFSLSATKSFDTGSFGNGQSRSVSFDKPGAVEVECAVHPDMRLDVEVVK